jgi:hypothetical protein
MILPNQSTLLMRDRSFDALNDPSSVPDRQYDRYWAVTQDEEILDALGYFTSPGNKSAMEEEFVADLGSCSCGVSSRVASLYFQAIKDYQDGGSTAPLRMLKHAVRAYMFDRGATVNIRENLDAIEGGNEISGEDIRRILRANQFNLVKHFDAWKRQRHHDISDDEIYLRRGIGLSTPLVSGAYQEAAWITSYTLALSVAEAFANRGRPRVENIIHLQYEDARSRVLFFSPFVPGVHPKELELGLIPFAVPRRLEKLFTEGRYEEYLVSDKSQSFP